MATESVAIKLENAHSRIREAIAIQEMISRMTDDSETDFEMIRQACFVTFRLLEEASGDMEPALPNGAR